ncbi:MAG: PilZ domain-containing protein [Planctomycetota bacterium]|nr:PilZ domain-containing protein [Planctomycetota bacterium]
MKDFNEDLLLGAEDESRLLSELERQSLEQIKQLRAHERMTHRVGVRLRPGNASQRGELDLAGKTGDISEGGCGGVFPEPVMTGDIYQLEFDPKAIDLPVVFAQAMRCRMLSDTRFEVGFRFFTRIQLPKNSSERDLLG